MREMAIGIPVTLPDRGQVVIDYIDLYDEGQCGAGKLAYRGSYESMGDLKSAIEEVLTVSPIEEDGKATNPLSFNRFDTKDRHGWRMPVHPLDLYPWKSKWMVHFLLRFKFLEDFCYVELGINWAPFINPNTGDVYEKYPLGDYSLGQIFSLSDLSVVRVYNCTAKDAYELVKELNLSDPEGDDIHDLDLGITDDQLDTVGDVELLADGQSLLIDEDSLLVNE